MSFLAISPNGKFCDPPACFLKIRKTALLAVPAAAIQQLQLLAALQAENHGIKHYCRQHHYMPSIYFIPPPFSGKFFLELFSGEWTENNSNN